MKISILELQNKIEYNNWLQVFSASLGKVISNQEACSEMVVKGQNWNVDFSKGIILFGSNEYPIQFIGSESTSSGTWLWGWENVNGFSDSILKEASRMKAFGDNYGLEPFSVKEFSLDSTFNGHSLSIVTCALAENEMCYYRGTHSGGAILVAFSNIPADVFAPIDALKFSRIAMQCIQQFTLDHKIFIESFLNQNATLYEWKGNSIVAHFQQDMEIEFEQADGLWRVHKMTTIAR